MLVQTSLENTYIFAADGLYDILRRSSKKLGDDGELIDVVLARKEWFAFQHLGKDTTGTPDVDLYIVFLPCQHDLWRPVVARRNITSHLGVLDTSQTKVADFQITVLVDQDVAGLEVAVNHTGGMHIFESSLFRLDHSPSCCLLETHQYLVQEVLDELLFEGSGGEETVEIGAEELGDKVTGWNCQQ